jgi:hypothetical protein
MLRLHATLERGRERVRRASPLVASRGARKEFLAAGEAASRTAFQAGHGLKLAARLWGPVGSARYFLALPEPGRAAWHRRADRRVRHPRVQPGRLTAGIGRRKTRIRALAQAMVPTIGTALSEGLNHTDLAVLERCADPRALLAAGPARLTRLIAKTSRGQLGAAKAQALRVAAAEAVALWDGDSAIAIADLAAEVASEVRLVRAAEAERARHEHARDAALARVDPAGLGGQPARLGPVGAAQLVAAMGRPGRFPHAGAFKAFTGLTPRANQTGQTDRKHQPMTKAGPRALRSQLIQFADTARKLDPQLAAVYHAQMTQRGATHRKALCVVGARLAERGWLTLARGQPYVICDLAGRPVASEQAKRLIAEQFTVTAEVHRRRRSTKTGKAPHKALEAQGKSQREAGHEATFPTASLTTPSGIVNQPT